ncbi:MAG: histone deacetylase family protein [Thermomicrobiales bacterium]
MSTHAQGAAAASIQRPTAVLRSPRFSGHRTGAHPENPERLDAVNEELRRQELLEGRPEVAFEEATREQVCRVHDPDYLVALERFTAAGGGALDPDTLVLPDSLDVARLAAGAAVAATDAVLDGRVDRAFCLVRPPGHHATPSRGMGFCLLNTVAIAAADALARGLERVLIIDWDVHHGNGTQDAFYATDRVLSCSIHQSLLYPGTGEAAEVGIGEGKGFTLNIPLAPGSGDVEYGRVFDEIVLPRARDYGPQLVLLSAGFDAHEADPLADMRVTTEGFAALAERVIRLAEEAAGGHLVAILEGGYHRRALARSVAAVLKVFDTDHDADREARATPLAAPEKR